jgi:hypothetical protein
MKIRGCEGADFNTRVPRWLRCLAPGCVLMVGVGMAGAAGGGFAPRELFQIPFGSERGALGSRVEGGNLILPRDFTMDGAGRFYIYDLNKHRIARFSPAGKFEMAFRYLPTARQVFAHADSKENLWLLLGDPAQGIYYGIYDSRGKRLKSGVFAQFDRFRLHLDDEAVLRAILSSSKNPAAQATFLFDEERMLLRKENIAPPPATHHRLRRSERLFYIDEVPGSSAGGAHPVNRITDPSRRSVADIRGRVIYITSRGEIFTRVGECEIRVYDVGGSLTATARLGGLPSSCDALRFDSEGNLYQLDGIPGENSIPGMRLIRWERH